MDYTPSMEAFSAGPPLLHRLQHLDNARSKFKATFGTTPLGKRGPNIIPTLGASNRRQILLSGHEWKATVQTSIREGIPKAVADVVLLPAPRARREHPPQDGYKKCTHRCEYDEYVEVLTGPL